MMCPVSPYNSYSDGRWPQLPREKAVARDGRMHEKRLTQSGRNNCLKYL